MISKFIPKPWKILPKLLDIKLHCELKNIDIDLENKKRVPEYFKKEKFHSHFSGAFNGSWGNWINNIWW